MVVRMSTIQSEFKSIYDYKYIKAVGKLIELAKIDHPEVTFDYDMDEIGKTVTALRKEYDELREILRVVFPSLT